MNIFPGVGVSRGIAIGPVFQFRKVSLEFETYTPQDTAEEWERFQAAVDITRDRLTDIYNRAVGSLGTDEAAIFQAHLTILDDPDLHDSIREKIFVGSVNAESALKEVAEGYCQQLESLEDEYFRARATDIRDVSDSCLKVLLNVAETAQAALKEASIIISAELTPSDCLLIDKSMILGFCTIEGGPTSHTTILARSLGVPALVGVGEDVLAIENGGLAILDGFKGELVVDPDPDCQEYYLRLKDSQDEQLAKALIETHQPAITLDGHRVKMMANVGDDAGAQEAVSYGAEGVGLLRTEFIYFQRTNIPDEQTQYQIYRQIVDTMGDRPVILRTLDIGGDKQLPYLDLPYELNPFLGVRGIRLCLRNLDLFRPQLRAAIRAGSGRELLLMFPMVTKASELREARRMFEACRAELLEEGVPVAEHMEIGIMVEIPAAALLADHLADEVDFFSIGTNDLSQYTLAVDRTNASLSDLVNAFDPSVLRLVSMVVNAAHTKGKLVGVCGELAGEPLAIPILVGLGVDELSMNPPAIPIAKQIVRSLTFSGSKELAGRVLELETSAQVQECVKEHFPFLVSF
jgi:phosphoenolpyruvate-protein phosphotransferase (PTS system enzyme I)